MLRQHNDLCVRPFASDRLVAPVLGSRVGTAIWLCCARMQLADGAVRV